MTAVSYLPKRSFFVKHTTFRLELGLDRVNVVLLILLIKLCIYLSAVYKHAGYGYCEMFTNPTLERSTASA